MEVQTDSLLLRACLSVFVGFFSNLLEKTNCFLAGIPPQMVSSTYDITRRHSSANTSPDTTASSPKMGGAHPLVMSPLLESGCIQTSTIKTGGFKNTAIIFNCQNVLEEWTDEIDAAFVGIRQSEEGEAIQASFEIALEISRIEDGADLYLTSLVVLNISKVLNSQLWCVG
jgi:hypothetical protein